MGHTGIVAVVGSAPVQPVLYSTLFVVHWTTAT